MLRRTLPIEAILLEAKLEGKKYGKEKEKGAIQSNRRRCEFN